MPRGPALVVRFSSLGDVLLAAHLPSFLREAEPGRRVLFATRERFAPVLRGHPDVARFYLLADGTSDPAAPAPFGVVGSLGDLRAYLKREDLEEAYDLQQNLRSSQLLAAAPRRARRIAPPKHGLRRRLMVWARWTRPAPLPPLLHAYRALAGLDPAGGMKPWLKEALSDSERARALARLGGRAEPFAFLGVGARHETKRWPVERFAALGRLLSRDLGMAAYYAIAPGEDSLAAELRGRIPESERDRIVRLSIREAAALASLARVIVSNDSALLHLGPALGVPAVGIFGSTVPAFGFAPQGPRDEVVEIALACRPCGVHGRGRCPLGHHRCMRDLEPPRVLDAVRRAAAGSEAAA